MNIRILKSLLHKAIFYIPKKMNPYRYVQASLCFTRACNGKCPMCLRTHDSPHAAGLMSRDVFEKVVAELVRAGIKDVHIFNMGEPLIHPHFIEYVELLLKKGLRPNFSTNAELFGEKFYPVVAKLRHPAVSIEGYDKETVKKYRGIDFDKVYNNVKGFAGYLGPKGSFILRTALYKPMGEEYVRNFVRVWGAFFSEIQFSYAAPPQCSSITDMHITEYVSDEYYSFRYDENARCDVPGTSIVQPDGTVLACCIDYVNKHNIGDLTKQSFKEIFESKTNKEKFERLSKNHNTMCGNCWPFLKMNADDQARFSSLVALGTQLHKQIRAA